jgi:transposase
MKTRGGARAGSGRKPTPISESRAITLWNQGVSKKEIAKRFGVDYQVVLYFFKKKKLFKRGIAQLRLCGGSQDL